MKIYPPQKEIRHSSKKATALDWGPSVDLSEHVLFKK